MQHRIYRMMRAVGRWNGWMLGVCLSLWVAHPVQAWVQFKTKTMQKPMRWQKMPIQYAVDATGMGDYFTKNPDFGAVGSEFFAVEASFRTWASVFCPAGGLVGLTFQSQGLVSGKQPGFDENCDNCNTNLISFVRDPNLWTRSSTELAIAIPTARESSGQIFDADIIINAAHFQFTTQTENTDQIKWDLQNALTHEIGHILGLDHSLVPESTMYAQSGEKNLQMRDLHEDDVDGICTIYPPLQLVGKIPSYRTAEKSRGLGCSSANGSLSFGGCLGLLLLGWMLWRQRRRESL